MTHDEMDALTADTDNKSEKIRRLDAAGVSKGDIGRYLNIRYQHVYNVLLRAGTIQKEVPAEPSASVVSGEALLLALESGGTIRLPQHVLASQGLAEGDRLICRVNADGLTIMSRARAVEYLREAARERMPGDADLFDALLTSNRTGKHDQPG